ncbi:hypothetical protein PLICBS_004108 [Purpureocillium lilacinum]|uniref:uncharacterized protein n=1 Tax=Purpureocillium lilacinum TaxID=33203 RepID=UPI0020866D00|nr:hypothetical protein PLICBS_004108 [Purpureocillium lilacinum]
MSDITTSTAPGVVSPLRQDPAAEININVKTVAESSSREPDKTRPHVCAACQRSFARLEHLNRHERTHTQEKPFECPECARCFSRRDLLRRHQQKLHRTTTPSRSCHHRESATRVASGQCRLRNDSAAAVTAGANSAAACMWPRLNSITHVDGAAMQMFASGNASAAARGTAAQSCRPSLISFPIHSDQGETQHGLPKLDSPRTVPSLAAFDPGFNFEDIFFSPAWTIDFNSMQYDDSGGL